MTNVNMLNLIELEREVALLKRAIFRGFESDQIAALEEIIQDLKRLRIRLEEK